MIQNVRIVERRLMLNDRDCRNVSLLWLIVEEKIFIRIGMLKNRGLLLYVRPVESR